MPHQRGTTVVKINWKEAAQGQVDAPVRRFHGIAYTGAQRETRRTVKCSDEMWGCTDDDIFYDHPAISWTVEELKQLNLYGVPMRFQHLTKIPPVGKITGNYVDEDGNLCIVGEVPNNNAYQRAMINLIDSNICSDLSISYPLSRDEFTKVVTLGKPDEISFVTEGHFPGSRVNVTASASQNYKSVPVRTIFRTVRAMASNSAAPATAPAPAAAADGNANLSNNAKFLENLSETNRARDAAEKKARELEEKLAALEGAKKASDDELKKIKDQKEKEAKERRDLKAPAAKEVTDFMIQMAKEHGGADSLPDEFAAFNTELLLDETPIAMAAQVAQVSCHRGFRETQKKLIAAEKHIEELQRTIDLASGMATIDQDSELYQERETRRKVSAGRGVKGDDQTTRVAAPAPSAAPAPQMPAWQQMLLQSNNINIPTANCAPRNNVPAAAPPVNRRVAAGGPSTKVTDNNRIPAAPESAPRSIGNNNMRTAKPIRPGYPVNTDSLSNANPDWWNHLRGCTDVPKTVHIPQGILDHYQQE